mmetsp:Transcript_15404/g.32412  ORF Transcript_15404/g.32412 Transcript_15404/m.32412 type:complete len:92 (-) Transcript_15404:142-417(-)
MQGRKLTMYSYEVPFHTSKIRANRRNSLCSWKGGSAGEASKVTVVIEEAKKTLAMTSRGIFVHMVAKGYDCMIYKHARTTDVYELASFIQC